MAIEPFEGTEATTCHTFLRVPDFKAIPKQFRQNIWLLASHPKTTEETEAATTRGATRIHDLDQLFILPGQLFDCWVS